MIDMVNKKDSSVSGHEPPAKRYSPITVILTGCSIVFLGTSFLALVKPLHWIVPAVCGSTAVVLFLIAKRYERKDREKHGADHDSWMNKVVPGRRV